MATKQHKKFEGIFRTGRIKGYKAGEVEVRDYFIDKAQQTRINRSPISIIESPAARSHSVVTPTPGKLLMYQYDAKHKDTLPYWDRFPVMFPIDVTGKHFLGLNMHYLPPTYRVRLFDALFDNLNNEHYDKTTKVNVNYQILKAASNLKYFKPCLKKYLFSHVRSNLVEIPVEEWAYCCFLPLARFQKASQRRVWDDSIRKIMS